MKISTRLCLPTLAMASLLVLMGGFIARSTVQQVASADAAALTQERKLVDVSRWQGETNANIVRVVATLSSEDAAVEAALKPEIQAATRRISDIQKSVDAAASDPAEKALLARVAEARQAYIAARNAAVKLREAGQAAEALALLNSQVQPAVRTYQASQQDYVQQQLAHGLALRSAQADERMRTLWAVVGMMGLAVLGLAAGTVTLVRSVCRPMDELVQIARRVGEGDLDVQINTQRRDEVGAVLTSLAQMRDALRGIVGQVREASESIQVASAEVATGNTDLSQRTEQTASNLQQTASSLQQLTVNVRQSADAAAQANQLAASASSVAQRGGDVVAQVVSTMDEINHASKKIADIIGTIDGIAFQTNILALNAAVEAARAGEQGRGFAVVASEVRSLAQRSADAAREIKALIGSSVDKVETGTRLVQDAGTTMTEIVASVQRVSDIIGEISAASSEQSSGIGQINGAVSSLDQATQQNAALVEEGAAAAESLREQAQRLAQVVGEFRLGASSSAAALPAHKPANPGVSANPPRRTQTLAAAPVLAAPRPQASQATATAPTKTPSSRKAKAPPTRSPASMADATPEAAPHAPARVAQSTIERARDGARAAAGDDWESF